MRKAIAIPRRFYDDHVERDLPAPPIIKDTRRGYIIDGDSEHLDELLNDARFYADPYGPDRQPPGLKKAAKSLVWHLENA